MLRFYTLGATDLSEDHDRPSSHALLAQPKRLALLTYLTVSRPGSRLFRDTLLALFWPEFDTSHARRALRQTLYHLRRELGQGVIMSGDQSGVGVDTGRLWCDAVAFEQAIVEDRLEAALDLYRGEFMAGFHPDCGPDFEHWLDAARARLQRKAAAAAWSLAEGAEAGGDARLAGQWAQRVVDLLPYDEQAVRNLIRLLARCGDRGEAMLVFEALASRLERDLGLEPDVDTQALVAAIHEGEPDTIATRATETADAGDRDALVRNRLRGRALAVLPFTGLSGSDTEAVYAEGLTEMLITELARRASVSIVSRTSVQQYRRAECSLPAIARELNVDYVVEGTVLQARGRVRVTAQVLESSPERHIWAESFDRDVTDPLVLSAELATIIANGTELAIVAPSTRTDGSGTGEARDAYFQGRCQFVRMTPGGFAAAMRHFQEALRLDPGFAKAHAALAYATAGLARTGRVAPHEAYPDARRRAERALALDPLLAEAHMVLGACALMYDWDSAMAGRHLERGMGLNPELPDSHWIYSNFLCLTGRRAEARSAARRARELDPVVPTLWLNEVLILVGTGDVEGALRSAKEFAAFHRDFSGSAFALGMVFETMGRHEEAADAFARAEELGGGPHSIAARGHNLACAGRPDEARGQLQRLLDMQDQYVPPTTIARIYVALDEADEAFRWLDRAVAVRDDWLPFMDTWPRFEPIRTDPRFAALRNRIGLPVSS